MNNIDYFCSENALECMKTLTPDDFQEFIDTEETPDGHVVVTDDWTATYLLNRTDIKPDSTRFDEEPVAVIEYFENGIPEWLDPIPGTRFYLAEWTGSEWKFTKASGI